MEHANTRVLGADCLGVVLQGIAFLLMTIAPGQRESKRTVLAKEIAFGVFSSLLLGGSIYSTVVVASGSADLYIQGGTAHQRAKLISQIGGSLGTSATHPSPNTHTPLAPGHTLHCRNTG